MKGLSILKAGLFVVLASLTINTFANCCNCVYVGNPSPGRQDTVFVPGHYDRHGCWHQAKYIKFFAPVCSSALIWVPGQYDRRGNWVKGHYYYRGWYMPNHYRTVGASSCSVCGS